MGRYDDPYRQQRDGMRKENDPDFLIEEGQIELWHQCDGWFIGSPDDARTLIADLQRAITHLEEHQTGVVA